MLVLRKIDNKNRWRRPAWLVEGQLPADVLRDLQTEGNALSVYELDDARTRLPHLIAALAAKRDYLSQFEFAVFEASHLTRLGIKASPKPGDTADREANRWHVDLQELSVEKLTRLAELIMAGGMPTRITQKEVLQHIKAAVLAGRIERSRLQPQMATKLDRELEGEI